MLFISTWKLFSFLRYLNLWPNFFGDARKWLDKKAKVDFQMHDAIYLEANNYNTHIAQYFKK